MAGESTGAIITAAGANLAIAIAKFAGSWLTGSTAMLSEGVHSVVDTANQILLLVGLKRSARKADAVHPFGYGREVYFYSFVVALLIFLLGGVYAIYEGIAKVREPEAMGDALVFGIQVPALAINLGVLGFAILAEGYSLWKAYTALPKGMGTPLSAITHSKDPSLFVVVAEDLVAVAGLVIAAAGVTLSSALDLPVLDGIASIAIGLLLTGMAGLLMRETHGLLIGEAADPQVVQTIRALAEAEPLVEHVNEVLTQHLGPADILVNISLDVANDGTAGAVEELTTRLERAVKARHGRVRRVFVECQARQASQRPALGSAEVGA